MKKHFVVMMMAICAIGFNSCGNKSQAPADGTETVAGINVNDAVEEITAQITEQMKAGDANKLTQAIETIKVKVAEFLKENPEVAKEYVSKVQAFLKENAEQIKAVVGDNQAVQTTVATLVSTPAESIVNTLASAVEGVKDAGNEAIEATGDAVDDAVEGAKAAGQQVVDDAKQSVKDKVDQELNEATKNVNEGIDNAKKNIDETVNRTADDIRKGLGL